MRRKEVLKLSERGVGQSCIIAQAKRTKKDPTLTRAASPEYPLHIKGSGDFYLDFLCLNPHTGCEILWEHFGLMDNEDYRNNAISKLAKYSEAGFVPGRNFIYTMETTKTPLNSRSFL